MTKFFDNNNIIKDFKYDYNKKELWLYCMLYMYGGSYNFYKNNTSKNTWYIHHYKTPIGPPSTGAVPERSLLNNIGISTPASNNIFWKIIIYILSNPTPSNIYEYTNFFINLVNDKKNSNFLLEITQS